MKFACSKSTTLQSVYMVDKPLRRILQMPVQPNVDFRASCFKTKNPIDRGFVCSVCLSVFSESVVICPTCNMRRKTMRTRIVSQQQKPKPVQQSPVQQASVTTPPANSSPMEQSPLPLASSKDMDIVK